MKRVIDPAEEARRLAAIGYRRISNNYLMVARIDRPDWRKFMAYAHSPWDPLGEGMRWASGPGMDDMYRRTYSKDTRTVSLAVFRLIPGSLSVDGCGYIAAPREKPKIQLIPGRHPPMRPRWRCTNSKGEFADGPSPEAARLALQEMPR